MTGTYRTEWATDLADAIKDTWSLGPTKATWYKWLAVNVDHPDAATKAVAHLRRSHDSSALSIAAFAKSYDSIIRQDILTQKHEPENTGPIIPFKQGIEVAYSSYRAAGGKRTREQFAHALAAS